MIDRASVLRGIMQRQCIDRYNLLEAAAALRLRRPGVARTQNLWAAVGRAGPSGVVVLVQGLAGVQVNERVVQRDRG